MALASNSPRDRVETKISYHPCKFLKAAKRLSIDPSKCLVIEASLPGMAAAKAIEMDVVGLPAFEDWIDVTLPLEPWHIGGPVIEGYDRGSKFLGIPTFTNLSVEGYASVLTEHPAGVYFCWAKLSTR
ncbi:bifunctional riboflavin kinase/FMN phosphatase, partial [Tanacetum coccineum]